MSLNDTLYNQIIYYYMLVNQKSYNFYKIIIMNLIGFKNLMVYSDGKIVPFATLRFLFYYGITKLINLLYNLRNKIDINADKVHITKMAQENEQTIIMDKDMCDDKDSIGFEDIIVKMNMLQIDGTMANHMIVNLDLVNNNEKICLKNYMFKYNDSDEQHHHTLKNIFIFNNIDHDENSQINLKIFKNKKLITQTIPLKDIVDKHINHIIKI